MKVILLVNVENVGKKDQIVEVSDGYAMNFLIRKKLAVKYSEGTNESLQKRINDRNQEYEQHLYEANLLKKQIEDKTYIFKLKEHDGKSFGSISMKHLLANVNRDFPIVTKYMILGDHSWGLGEHNIKIKIFDNVIAILKIKVIGE